MIACIGSKTCLHYFVRTENLFEGIADEMLQEVGKKLSVIRGTLMFGRVQEQLIEDDEALSKWLLFIVYMHTLCPMMVAVFLYRSHHHHGNMVDKEMPQPSTGKNFLALKLY